jgi:hypothetical protein
MGWCGGTVVQFHSGEVDVYKLASFRACPRACQPDRGVCRLCIGFVERNWEVDEEGGVGYTQPLRVRCAHRRHRRALLGIGCTHPC